MAMEAWLTTLDQRDRDAYGMALLRIVQREEARLTETDRAEAVAWVRGLLNGIAAAHSA